jgi:hypothetical protein
MNFDTSPLNPLLAELNHHPIYAALRNLDDLRYFMSQHVYSVWDFMSLVKYLQHHIAPAGAPWLPSRIDPAVQRFINELVLEEETDQGLPDDNGVKTYRSHFMMYCEAMREIGADADTPLAFVEQVRTQGFAAAITQVPDPAQYFVRQTFAFISSGKAHTVAAALALGREHIIPGMFQNLLDKMGIDESRAPVFYYYLKRHIFLDGDFHGPMSRRLLQQLCADDARKHSEALNAAQDAIKARIAFWDGVLAGLT